jgi:hypothetical protein
MLSLLVSSRAGELACKDDVLLSPRIDWDFCALTTTAKASREGCYTLKRNKSLRFS